jgi:hypothetical protein
MKSKTSSDFWGRMERLPVRVQELARQKYALWRRSPRHPSLHFKELRPGLWSLRINQGYRALAWSENEQYLWFSIGTHADYDRMIRETRG